MKNEALIAQTIDVLKKYEAAADKDSYVINLPLSVVWLTGGGDRDFKENINETFPIMFRRLFTAMADPTVSAPFKERMGNCYEDFLQLMAEFMEFAEDMRNPTAMSQLIRVALETRNMNADDEELNDIISTYTGKTLAITSGFPEKR